MPTLHEKCGECGAMLTPRGPEVKEGWLHRPKCKLYEAPPATNWKNVPLPQAAQSGEAFMSPDSSTAAANEARMFQLAETKAHIITAQMGQAQPRGLGRAYNASNRPAHDVISAPAHYTQYSISAIEVIDSWRLNFALGSVLKYISRHNLKGGIEDLKKAAWYLAHEIAERERGADAGHPSA